MTKLPLLLSVPHAGLGVPVEVSELVLLTDQEIFEDGDVGAADVYRLSDDVEVFLTTEIARAFVDLNRAEDDRRVDGVVKTATCWQVPIYRRPLDDALIEDLLEYYYRPYHDQLTNAASENVRFGIDCHTMAAQGPPIGPDPGMERPHVCLSHAGSTCPTDWLEQLRECFVEVFGNNVRLNDPFQGGYITRIHAREMPWVQLEISRAPFASDSDKRHAVLNSLQLFCQRRFGTQ